MELEEMDFEYDWSVEDWDSIDWSNYWDLFSNEDEEL